MKNYAVIRDVSETLRQLFVAKGIPEVSETNIFFESPADIEKPTSATLSIFLYQVVANSHLRNIEPTPVGTDKMQKPPLILDLFYLFTPYANDRDTEFIVLEGLMQILHENAVLKGQTLKGKLIENGNDEIRVLPNNLMLEEANKLWERFPNKSFKLSVSYLITPVRIPFDTYDVTRVIEKDINMYLIGGKK